MDAKNASVKVIVASHKKYRMPQDVMYLPLQVGAEGKEDLGLTRDDTGENISDLNPSFCELTGMYWAWKNVDADYIGLVHYRRHFALKKKRNPWDSVLTYEQISKYLGRIRAFVPVKRRYYIETLYSHYSHTHYAEQLDITRDIIAERYPEYIESFDESVNKRSGYMFNMMIMESQLFDEYCRWLFDILFELKERLKDAEFDNFQGRFYGRVSEIIFNVWLNEKIKNGELSKKEIKEIPFIYMEKIDWNRKIKAFLKAKFIGKKYDSSF